MPVIGTFSAVKDGYAGTIRTLTMSTKVRIIANDRKEGEAAAFELGLYDLHPDVLPVSEAGLRYAPGSRQLGELFPGKANRPQAVAGQAGLRTHVVPPSVGLET